MQHVKRVVVSEEEDPFVVESLRAEYVFRCDCARKAENADSCISCSTYFKQVKASFRDEVDPLKKIEVLERVEK